MDNEKLKTENYSITTLIASIVAYMTLTGCFWHMGFWSSFNINFLEYANISDVFKSTIQPFFSSTSVYTGIFLTAFSIMYCIAKIPDPPIPFMDISNEKDTIHEDLVNWIIIIFIVCIGLTAGIIGGNHPYIISISISIVIAGILYKLDIFINLIKSELMRFVILILITTYPALNFIFAQKESIAIKELSRYQLVTDAISTDSTLTKTINNSAYLSSTADYIFFYKSSKVYIVKADKIISFTVTEVKRK